MTIKVLLVDDSATSRLAMSAIISSAEDMQIIGQAVTGAQAIEMTHKLRPDVLLMDVMMPGINGVEATREIMSEVPTPIVLISASADSRETTFAFEAMSAGALTVMQKPCAPGAPGYDAAARSMLTTLRSMSNVRVIRHRREHKSGAPASSRQVDTPKPTVLPSAAARIYIIGIVSSTGGPQTLGEILREIPADFAIPIVIVQHISDDFIQSLVDWLNTVSKLPVKIAQPGAIPEPGAVYIAPGGSHLQLSPSRRFAQTGQPASALHIPSGDVLLSSLAQSYGENALGIILTGMGKDGAAGLLAMRQAGASTIAQTEDTCIVYGMPQVAVALGAAQRSMSPKDIAQYLNSML